MTKRIELPYCADTFCYDFDEERVIISWRSGNATVDKTSVFVSHDEGRILSWDYDLTGEAGPARTLTVILRWDEDGDTTRKHHKVPLKEIEEMLASAEYGGDAEVYFDRIEGKYER